MLKTRTFIASYYRTRTRLGEIRLVCRTAVVRIDIVAINVRDIHRTQPLIYADVPVAIIIVMSYDMFSLVNKLFVVKTKIKTKRKPITVLG